MRVIGVDPGSLKAGFGILESNPNGILHLSSGLLSLDPKKTMTERLTELFSDLESLIQKYKVDEMAIESIFFAKNAQSALKLGQARGAALIAAGRANLPIFEYPARSVKSAICGSGKADKQQIEHMIRILLKLPKSFEFRSSDHSDALAICLAHVQTRATESRRENDSNPNWQSSEQETNPIHH